jgi:RHS repeat-associated protein
MMLDASTGTPVALHDYLPFGEEIVNARPGSLYSGTDDPRQKFTGKERDSETSLDYFGARYFSGAQGRFTSPDQPLGDQNPANPQSWNLFSYVRNNALTNVDPSGQDCVTTSNQTETSVGVTVTSGSCNGSEGAYVPGTVDMGSLTYNGTSVGYSYAPYDSNSLSSGGTLYLGRVPSDALSPLAASVFGQVYQQSGLLTRPGFWAGSAGASLAGGALVAGGLAVSGAGLTTLGLQAAGAVLPAVPSAIDKLQKLGISVQQANEIIASPTAQKFIDKANSGNINVLQEMGGKIIRVTLDPTASRIISAGIVQSRNVTNSIASGRFTPLQ